MNLTDEQIEGIIGRYAHNVQTANQKEDGWMLTAMRRALSDYWPQLDEQEIRVDQAIYMTGMLATALQVVKPTRFDTMVEEVMKLKSFYDTVQPQFDALKKRVDDLER